MWSQEPPEGGPSPYTLGPPASLPSNMAAREGPPAASGDADAVDAGPLRAGCCSLPKPASCSGEVGAAEARTEACDPTRGIFSFLINRVLSN